MRLIKTIKLFSLAGILILSGCMSERTTTDFKPEANTELKSSAGKFYIEGLTYANNIPIEQKNQPMLDVDKRLLVLLRKECIARYPELFSEDASSSIPLWVDVNQITTIYNAKSLTWLLCTGLLCGLVFPLPGGSEEQFAIKAGVWNGQEGIKGASIKKDFQRTSSIWSSALTPSALITIPGESDFPKWSYTEFNIKGHTDAYEVITAQQISTALAKSVSDKDLSFWSARPLMLKGAQSIPEAIQASTNQTDAF